MLISFLLSETQYYKKNTQNSYENEEARLSVWLIIIYTKKLGDSMQKRW